MRAIEITIDALFADPNIARDALYRAQATGGTRMVRVVTKRPDEVLDFGDGRVVTATTVAEVRVSEVRVSEVAEPQEGDTLQIGDAVFVIQGVPRRDAERLVFSLDLRPV